jgi:hypothetical protein
MPIIVSGALVLFADKNWRLKSTEIIEKTKGKYCQFLSIKNGKFCFGATTAHFESPGNWAFAGPKIQKSMA